ncbi:MAG: hypothetical protein IPF95_08430 [Flavobacteriales bacterium]|nr:hypothetical protein [Flavobacteriales bacterium]
MNLTKQTMKTAERSLLIIALLGFGMKMLHLPTAAIVLTIGSVLLATLYFLRGKTMIPETNRDRSHLPIITLGSVSLGVSVLALLLKVQHWPFATSFALLGVVLCAATIFAVTTSRKPSPRETFKRLLLRVVPALLLVGVVALMPFI